MRLEEKKRGEESKVPMGKKTSRRVIKIRRFILKGEWTKLTLRGGKATDDEGIKVTAIEFVKELR